MSVRFGTDGVRGRAGELPCTVEVAVAMGRAVARLARQVGDGSVVVARDPRPSGHMLVSGVLAGVCAQGGRAFDAGLLPTSAVSVAIAEGRAAAGVMVTASHNPWTDNGFKVFGPGGYKLDDPVAAKIEAWLAAPAQTSDPGEIIDARARAKADYFAALTDALSHRHLLAGRRVAIDLANGAAQAAKSWLEASVPVDWVFVGGSGRINDGCGAQHPERLAAAVLSHGCDAGFAVDGDADRCVLVDDTGAVLSGDALAWLLALHMGVKRLAVTVMSSAALDAGLPGVQVLRTPVGDRHLSALLRSDGLALGCEDSGHVLFADALPGGDGLVTGVRALGYALREGRLSEQVAEFQPLPRVLTAVPVGQRPPVDRVPVLVEAVDEGRAALGTHGRVFLRYSGTEPVIRVLVEGVDAVAVAEVSRRVTSVCERVLA